MSNKEAAKAGRRLGKSLMTSYLNGGISEKQYRTLIGADMPNYTDEEHDAFVADVNAVLKEVGDLLAQKNLSYGNAALDPRAVMSSATPHERIYCRVDEKLARIARSRELNRAPATNDIQDLIGCLVLLQVAGYRRNTVERREADGGTLQVSSITGGHPQDS